MALYQNIMLRKQEALQTAFELANLTEETVDPKEWGKTFPRQYDSYLRTVDTQRTRYGGSENFQKLDDDPRLRTLFAGYAFSIDYREERGHAYMLSRSGGDGAGAAGEAAGGVPAVPCVGVGRPIAQEGIKAGVPDDAAHRQEAIMKGFEQVCAMPYAEARNLVTHPVTCIDCHDPETLALRVTRPGFSDGHCALGQIGRPACRICRASSAGGRDREKRLRSEQGRQPPGVAVDGLRPMPRRVLLQGRRQAAHLSVAQRSEGRADRKVLRRRRLEGLCTQGKRRAGAQGAASGVRNVVARHSRPQRRGLCRLPHALRARRERSRSATITIRSPLLNISRACQQCHNYSETEILGRAEAIQERTKGLLIRAEDACIDAIDAISSAAKAGANDEQLKSARKRHRQAQWRMDFVAAENSLGFHAPQESARILGEAIDLGRQAELAAVKATRGNANQE